MSLLRQSAETMAWQLGGLWALMVSGMLTARYLGPEDRGLLAAAYLYPALATILGSLSLGASIIHHFARGRFRPEEYAGTLAAASLGLGGGTLVVVLVGGCLGGESLHRGIPWALLIVVLLSVPFLFVLGYFSSLLQAALDFRAFNAVMHGPKLLNLVVVLLLLALGRLRVWDLVIIGTAVSAIVGFAPVRRMRRHAPGPWQVRGDLFRILAADGLRIHLGVVASFFAGRANLFFANYYLPKADVGFLYIAVTLAELIWLLSVAAETVLYPHAAHLSSADAISLTARVCRQVFALSLGAGVILGLFAPWVVAAYAGRAYLPATTPLRLLLPGITALTISKILSALWIREGWFWLLSALAGSTALLSVLLNLVLVPSLGTSGAALATTLPYLFNAGISVALYRCRLTRELHELWRLRWEDVQVLVGALRRWAARIGNQSWNSPLWLV